MQLHIYLPVPTTHRHRHTHLHSTHMCKCIIIHHSLIHIGTDCEALPHPENGLVIAKGLAVGSRVYYSCDYGYNLTKGSEVRICQENLQWSGTAGVCERKFDIMILTTYMYMYIMSLLFSCSL